MSARGVDRYDLEIFNSSNPYFYLVHITGITSLSISILVSVGTLIFLYLDSPVKNVSKRRRGERLVFYLAVADLLYSCEHISGHIYAVIYSELTSGLACIISAFFLQEFFTAQTIIVLATAFSSYMLVRHQRKIGLGKYDCGLLLTAFGLPALIGILLAGLGLLGPSDYWCLADLTKPVGFIVDNIYTGVMLTVALLNIFFYISTWHKVSSISRMLRATRDSLLSRANGSGGNTYGRTSFLMLAIVAAFFIQWWPYMVYAVWHLFESPHIAIVECMVIFCNMGGVFNFLAYTFIRRIYRIKPSSSTSEISVIEKSRIRRTHAPDVSKPQPEVTLSHIDKSTKRRKYMESNNLDSRVGGNGGNHSLQNGHTSTEYFVLSPNELNLADSRSDLVPNVTEPSKKGNGTVEKSKADVLRTDTVPFGISSSAKHILQSEYLESTYM